MLGSYHNTLVLRELGIMPPSSLRQEQQHVCTYIHSRAFVHKRLCLFHAPTLQIPSPPPAVYDEHHTRSIQLYCPCGPSKRIEIIGYSVFEMVLYVIYILSWEAPSAPSVPHPRNLPHTHSLSFSFCLPASLFVSSVVALQPTR